MWKDDVLNTLARCLSKDRSQMELLSCGIINAKILINIGCYRGMWLRMAHFIEVAIILHMKKLGSFILYEQTSLGGALAPLT